MRKRLMCATLTAGLAGVAMLSAATPAAAQQGTVVAPVYRQDPRLNPEDQLAPSQLAQPMPAPVQEPTAAPVPRQGARRAETAAKPAPRPAPAHARRTAPPHRTLAVRTVIACSGPFAKDSGMQTLSLAYDEHNMAFREETVDGGKVAVTVLFPNDPRRRLEVWWAHANRTGTYLIDIAGRSIWTAPKGLRLGLTLDQLQKLNRKPFKLKGFNEDGVASVADWNDGELAALPGGCKAGVSLKARARGNAAFKLPASEQLASNNPALRVLKPAVSEILIGY